MTNAVTHGSPDDEGRPPRDGTATPSALIYKKAILHIAATAAIDPKSSMPKFSSSTRTTACLGVCPSIPGRPSFGRIHKDTEAANLHRVSSTVKGAVPCRPTRSWRRPVLVENDNSRAPRRTGTEAMIEETERGRPDRHYPTHWKILFETAQGFDLSLEPRHPVPFSTSRDITTCQALSDAVRILRGGGYRVRLPSRLPYPRRQRVRSHRGIGGDEGRTGSGPYYPDQKELSWDEITQLSGAPYSLLERTT